MQHLPHRQESGSSRDLRSSERNARTAELVERNIAALLSRRAANEQALGWQEWLAGVITTFAGSMAFVWLHLAIYGGWIAANLGVLPGVPPFDPSFVILAMAASVEAIFLSTFILITQNRMQAQADRRADLNLQISLLAEHEITRLVEMVSEIGDRLGAPAAQHPGLDELKEHVKPETVLDAIERQEGASASSE
jgi:uncharacterized membrane protein